MAKQQFSRQGRQTTSAHEVTLIEAISLRCAGSGTVYGIRVTGFYDARSVLNVEFNYGPVVDDRDNAELSTWQTAYVNKLGRRVP